jgi:hypothetical protein
MNLVVPSMLTSAEKEYIYRYAKNEFKAIGEIVDLGCWLGSSTVPLAAGIQENSEPKTKNHLIHAYDIFVWEAWMDQLSCVAGTSLEGKFKPGDSFYDECLTQTYPWREQIQFHQVDLTKTTWENGAIEMLFIDAMKSWELANSIIQNFFPSLIPGHSIVVHQDFTHYYTYWIHLTMYRFREYFDVVYDIPYSASLVFKYKKQIPQQELQKFYSVESFDVDEINAAFDYSASLVSPEKRPVILAGKIKAFTELGTDWQPYRIDAALADLHEELSKFQSLILVRQEGWAYYGKKIMLKLKQIVKHTIWKSRSNSWG